MANTFYDDFKAMTAEKMAGSMEDMTFAYHETRVPKTHYKKMLGTGIEQVMEASVEVNLIQPYISIIKQMAAENPKSFFKALLCVDAKVTISGIRTSEWQALETLWQSRQPHDTYLPKASVERFKTIARTGMDTLSEEIEKEQTK